MQSPAHPPTPDIPERLEFSTSQTEIIFPLNLSHPGIIYLLTNSTSTLSLSRIPGSHLGLLLPQLLHLDPVHFFSLNLPMSLLLTALAQNSLGSIWTLLKLNTTCSNFPSSLFSIFFASNFINHIYDPITTLHNTFP